MSDRRVSILVPCYQQAHLLPQAVESALAQTAADVEIVIVNDGSTDETHEVATRFVARYPNRVRFLEQHNRGLTMARATGLNSATGRYVVFLDADDVLAPEMVATCLAGFAEQPEADLAVGNAWTVAEDGRSNLRSHDQHYVPRWPGVLEANPFGALVGVMARVDSVRRVGGLAVEGLRACEDWDLWIRMIRCGMRVVTVGGRLGWYRQHPSSLSRDPLLMLDSKLLVFARCARADERLAAQGLRPAPPISPRAHARLRNGAVFYALGMGLALDVPAERHNEFLSRLVPGGLDPVFCGQQFAFGWWHALRDETPPADATLAAVLARVTGRLTQLGLGAAGPLVERETWRALHRPRDLVWFVRAVSRRLRRAWRKQRRPAMRFLLSDS